MLRRNPFRFALATVLACLLAPTLYAQGDQDGAQGDAKKSPPKITSLPRIPAEVHEAIQSRSYDEAIEQLDQLLVKPRLPEDTVAYLSYLRGIAFAELNRYDEAIKAYQKVEDDFPDSVWANRAQFGRAGVLVDQRLYNEAGLIYREQAEKLLSHERKDELASIYLEFADRYYEGIPADDPSQAKRPDFKQALTYYQEAAKLKPTSQLMKRLDFRIARCFEETGSDGEAIGAFGRFLTNYSVDEPKLAVSATLAELAEVRYRLGAVQLKANQHAAARRTWQDMLRAEEFEAADDSVDEFLAQAKYRLAHTYGLPKPGSVGDLELAVAAAERFLDSHPNHALAAVAELEVAQGFLHHKRYESAIDQLKQLIENPKYVESKQLPVARRQLGQAYLASQQFDRAIEAWGEFLDRHPTDPNWPSVQQQIVDAEYAKAQHANANKDYELARTVWQTFMNKYPLDARAPGIFYQFGQMNFKQGVDTHYERVREAIARGDSAQSIRVNDECKKLFLDAIADWRRLVNKYPSSNEASQAAFMIGVTLEDRLQRLPEALERYKEVKGNYEGQAKQRISRLTTPHLEIATERKYRSDEKPRIKLTTRNIEKVTVKVYRVDMTDYFRKMHLARGIESLDIALIDPDQQFEHSVAEYQQYGRIDSDIEIPVDGVGVSAVTVSSDELDVTTMLVVSDIDVIVKASRNELFLFVEDMRTGKPAPGTSVLISDGSQVFAEAVTGDDGVLKTSDERFKSITDLRVFAIRDGHVASTVNQLNGLDFAVGLTPRGYLYTDRPAYRAGQLVNIKGIVRWVDQDRFTFSPGEKFKLDVYDSRGRQIQSSDVLLNEFGTISNNLILPETAPQGEYRVHLHRTRSTSDDLSFETRFAVAEYRLEPVEVVIDLNKDVYYRGEKVVGSATLRYYYGTPLSDEKVILSFGPGSEQITAKTDAEGKVDIEFDTQRFSEAQALTLAVQYPDRGIASSKNVYLATRGFEIGVDWPREVYISGESFEATFNVSDPAGSPVETDLVVEVFLQTKVNGTAGQRLVDTYKVKSDATTGKTRKTLTLEEGGRYIVRATGTDQFGNDVSGQKRLLVSGDKDKTRLRILAQRHSFEVGEEANVQLHWRESPALALVTFEGARILQYELVNLKNGVNKLDIPMVAELAPNFFLSVAVMQRNEFHTATSGFQVAQRLNVVLKPNKTTLRPGDPLTVDIEVTDPQGKPVAAELSLALVQSNLLNRFSEFQGAIQAFFGADVRRRAVRQTTSCTFKYRPTTQRISEQLLAEVQRIERLQQQTRALGEVNEWHAMESNAFYDAITPEFDDSFSFEGRRWGVEAGGADIDMDGDGIIATIELAEMAADGRISGMVEEDFEGLTDELRSAYQQSGTRRHVIRNGAQVPANLSIAGQFAGQSAVPQTASGAIPNRYRQRIDVFYEQLNVPGQGVAGPGPGVITTWDRPMAEDVTINGLTGRGVFLAFNGRDVKKLKALAKNEGVQLLPRMASAETAFWNPRIATDDAGKAQVVLTLPGRSTSWKLRSKAINKSSLGGQASVEILTKKELFAEVRMPSAFTSGDKAVIPVEIHNSLEGKRSIEAALTLTLGDKTVTEKKKVEVDGAGISTIDFAINIDASERAEIKVELKSQEITDSVVRTAAIRPYGFPVYQTISGSSAQSTLVQLGFEESIGAENPTLQVVLGGSIDRTLIEGVLGTEPSLDRCGIVLGNSLERSLSDVIGGTALLQMIGNADEPSPESQAIAGRVTAAISELVSAQRDDGAWSWSGRPNGPADAYFSARAMWALATARRRGLAVAGPAYEKGRAYLKSSLASAPRGQIELQTVLMHALAETKDANFAIANRLYRQRNQMNDASLVHLSLALSAMNHNEMSTELLALVKANIEVRPDGTPAPAGSDLESPWTRNGVELRALLMLAHQRVAQENAKIQKLAKWLLASRVGSRWTIEKANGPAIAALADWHSRGRHTAEKYTMTVSVNNEEVETFTFDPSEQSSKRMTIPSELLKAGATQAINFDMTGRGRFSYSAVLTGFVPAEKLTSSTKDWTVSRRYEPARRLLDGKEVARGFGVVEGSYRPFYNTLTELPVGARCEVTLSPRRRYSSNTPDQQHHYLVLSEPLPAGCTVLDGSVTGDFQRFEISDGSITFFVGAKRTIGDVRYTLVGYVPGQYKLAPSSLRSFYDPSRMSVAKTKLLAVLGRDKVSSDQYKLTPDELYHFGGQLVAKKDFEQAHQHLAELFENWRLKAKQNQQVVGWLFETSLARNDHAHTVKYFEILKEKFPSVELTFEQILQVALAYRELREYERSYLVYRSTVEASFERESQVAGFLNARGEFVRSVAAMESLLADYPPESYVATATYALAQEVYRRSSTVGEDKRLKEDGFNRVHLISEAIEMLDHFVTNWPSDPADDQASFALATALIDLDRYESAIERCQAYAKRYPDSRLLDSYWYMIGYSHFELEDHERALEMCRKVADASFPVAETGSTRVADNKWEAIYIMGQVYHSLGKAADAIIEYGRVKERFADAAEAIEFFTRKEIAMDEVTTIEPDAEKTIELNFRNISELAVKVYRIDLMKFGLMQRNLDRITAINLAGIKPYHEETVSLGDGKDYRDRSKDLRLPLKDEGAYLVVCRGEHLYASGLVLVSPLALNVAEDVQSGRVRVTVKDSASDSFVGDVHVKVIGSANDQFQSGATDLRGLFVADDIKGSSTVIALVDDDKYAFFRGQTSLQGVPAVPAGDPFGGEASAAPAPSQPAEKAKGKSILRGNIFNMNGDFQEQQKGNIDELLYNDRDGFAPSEAF